MSMQVKKHLLEPVNTPGSKFKYRCKVCQQEWVTHPTSICPGARVFLSRDPKDFPAQYKTLAELEAKGLRPRNLGQPSGAFRPSRQAPWELLYDETKAVPISLSNSILKLFKIGGGLGVGLLNIVITGMVSILFGFNSPPASLTRIPLFVFVLHNQLVSLIIFCGIVLITFIGSILFLKLTSDDSGLLMIGKHIHPWSIVTATSTISFLLCFVLLMVVLVRPSWCPGSLCPQVSLTNPMGVHDANLDVYFFTFQGSAIVIPGDPRHASATEVANDKNPGTVNAVLLKNHQPSTIYRLVLIAHRLYTGRYSILIDQVALIVAGLPVLPQQLNVWVNNPLQSFDVNRYSITYNGEGAGLALPARYVESPNGYTILNPGESDQLDVEINSRVTVALRFEMQVTYHIATETKSHKLLLPQVFEVVFSDHWHQYQLQGQHFVEAH
jgi:hypothetical protein